MLISTFNNQRRQSFTDVNSVVFILVHKLYGKRIHFKVAFDKLDILSVLLLLVSDKMCTFAHSYLHMCGNR